MKKILLLMALFLSIFVFSNPASAFLFRVTHEITFDDFSDLGVEEAIFGIPEDSGPVTMVSSFLIDTEAAPIKHYTTGEEFAGSDETAAHDFYGYSPSAISDLDVSFGSKTWDETDIRLWTIDPDVAVWFDTELVDGAAPSMAMAFNDSEGGLVLGALSTSYPNGPAEPGVTRILQQGFAAIFDYSSVYGPIAINATGAIIHVTEEGGGAPVPEPSTMLIMGTGLVGLVLPRFRKKLKQSFALFKP